MHVPFVADLPPVYKLTATQLLDEELSQRRKIWGGVASTSIHLGMAIVSHGASSVSCIWAAYNLTRTIMRHRELRKEIKKRRLRCHKMRKRDYGVPLAISILTPGLADLGGDLANDVAFSSGANQTMYISGGGDGGDDAAPFQNCTRDLGSGGFDYSYSSPDASYDSFYSPSDSSGSLSPDYDYSSGAQSWADFEYNPNFNNPNYSLPDYAPSNVGGDWGSYTYSGPQDPQSFGAFGASPPTVGNALPDFSVAASTDPNALNGPMSLAYQAGSAAVGLAADPLQEFICRDKRTRKEKDKFDHDRPPRGFETLIEQLMNEEANQSRSSGAPVSNGSIWCDSCRKMVDGKYYSCGTCKAFDICAACHSGTAGQHPHPLIENSTRQAESASTSQVDVEALRRLVKWVNTEQVRYQGGTSMFIYCNQCVRERKGEDARIEGVHFKCLQCDDFDCCTECLPKMERPGWHPEDHTFIPIQSQSSSNPNRTSASDPAINTTSRPRLDASFIPNHTPKAGYGPLPSRPGGSSEFTPSSAKSADSSSSFDSVGSLAPPDPNAPPPVYPRHSRQHQHQHQRSRSQVWSSSPNSDRHTNRTPQPGESQSQNQYRQQPQHRRNRSVDAPARDKDRGEEKQWGADRNEDNKLDRQSVLHRASTTQLPHHLGSKEDSSAPPSNIRRIVSTTKPVPKARVMSNANLWCDACRKPISGEGVEWMVCELCTDIHLHLGCVAWAPRTKVAGGHEKGHSMHLVSAS